MQADRDFADTTDLVAFDTDVATGLNTFQTAQVAVNGQWDVDSATSDKRLHRRRRGPDRRECDLAKRRRSGDPRF